MFGFEPLSIGQVATILFVLLIVLPIVTRKRERRREIVPDEDVERPAKAFSISEREALLIRAAGSTP